MNIYIFEKFSSCKFGSSAGLTWQTLVDIFEIPALFFTKRFCKAKKQSNTRKVSNVFNIIVKGASSEKFGQSSK